MTRCKQREGEKRGRKREREKNMSAKHEYVRGEERSGTEGTEPIAAIKKREWEVGSGKKKKWEKERGKKREREEVGKERENNTGR